MSAIEPTKARDSAATVSKWELRKRTAQLDKNNEKNLSETAQNAIKFKI
ncbi:hypothetical protein H4S14_000846 [Agrobacterium vitis]|nr:hypothetical protein [Agrobacterium vitis]